MTDLFELVDDVYILKRLSISKLGHKFIFTSDEYHKNWICQNCGIHVLYGKSVGWAVSNTNFSHETLMNISCTDFLVRSIIE